MKIINVYNQRKTLVMIIVIIHFDLKKNNFKELNKRQQLVIQLSDHSVITSMTCNIFFFVYCDFERTAQIL